MKRLTERLENGVINVKYASQHETAIHRLVTIEDILGDEYDMDELKEMVQANIPRLIDEQSTISAVPVVRCRECENYDENGDCISLDLRIGIHSDTINYDFCPDPDFYCAYGRRKIEPVLPISDAKDESLEETHANTRKNAR